MLIFVLVEVMTVVFFKIVQAVHEIIVVIVCVVLSETHHTVVFKNTLFNGTVEDIFRVVKIVSIINREIIAILIVVILSIAIQVLFMRSLLFLLEGNLLYLLRGLIILISNTTL